MVEEQSYDQLSMSTAATIILARDDLSIPGAVTAPDRSNSVETHFFELVDRARPDIIVLDLSGAASTGTQAILTVRGRTDIPILVVCDPKEPALDDYRIAGAADCVAAPVNIIVLHEAIQNILRARGRESATASRAPQNLSFAGMSFYPGRNMLAGQNGSSIELTSSEGRLLGHLLSKPWTLCTRNEIGKLLYGSAHSVRDRSVDVVVNRLRKKLTAVGGSEAKRLIKTEFRHGYSLVAEVAMVSPEPSTARRRL